MSSETLVLVALVAIATLIALGLLMVPAYIRHLTRRLPRHYGLTLPTHLEPTVRTRTVRRERGAALGALAMVLLSVPTLGAIQPNSSLPAALQQNPLVETWTLLAAVLTGGALGAALAPVFERSLRQHHVRIARSRAVSLRDYLGRLERVSARTLVAIGVLGMLATLVLVQRDIVRFAFEPVSAARIALCVFAIAALVLFEVFGRRIVERPAPAVSPLELAWDDALRSATIHDLANAPIMLGGFASAAVALDVVLMVMAPQPVNPTLAIVIAVAAAVAFLAGAILAIVAIVSKPQQHYLRTLWAGISPAVTPATASR